MGRSRGALLSGGTSSPAEQSPAPNAGSAELFSDAKAPQALTGVGIVPLVTPEWGWKGC